MIDEGHELTESNLKKLEKRINRVYSNAQKDLDKQSRDYFSAFEKRDNAYRAKMEAGEISKADYQQWRLNSIARGKRFEQMRDRMAERASNANEVAIAYVNDMTPSIYSLNRNFASWQIEKAGAGVSFNLFDESTVRKMIVTHPDVMPYYPKELALRRGFDLEYGKRQITAQVTSSIMQGKPIGKLADDLQNRIVTMSRTSAIRSARTATTAAQNGGRMDSYIEAEQMGIVMMKKWIATHDERTRQSHSEIDGEMVGIHENFSNGLRYPADPTGPASEVYNCRCTMRSVVEWDQSSNKKKQTKAQKQTSSLSFTDWLLAKASEALVWSLKI